FGALRGAVLALVLVHLGELSPLAEAPAWRSSPLVAWLRAWTRELGLAELAQRLPARPWPLSGPARPSAGP
ncbi:MAG: hypothetical protein D6809_05005, partial [Gammaproteobacteria bacterium]